MPMNEAVIRDAHEARAKTRRDGGDNTYGYCDMSQEAGRARQVSINGRITAHKVAGYINRAHGERWGSVCGREGRKRAGQKGSRGEGRHRQAGREGREEKMVGIGR